MKSLRSVSVLTLLFCLALFVVSCGGGDHSHEHGDHGHDHSHDASSTSAQHGEGKEYTSAYVCPMHCADSGSEEAGKCPVCGMDYVAQAEHTSDGHTHDSHNHDGHNH